MTVFGGLPEGPPWSPFLVAESSAPHRRQPSVVSAVWITVLSSVVGFVGLMLMGVLPFWLLPAMLLFPVAALTAIVHVARGRITPSRDSPVGIFCDGCGYEIVGASIARCPECGGEAFSRVAPPSPAARRWARAAAIVTLLWAGVVIVGQSYAAITTGGALFLPMAYAVLIAIPGSLLVLVPMVLAQRTTVGRMAFPRTLGVLALVLASILATGWPHTLFWTMHQPAFDRLHARVQAGETIAVPHAVGVLRVRQIDLHPGGAVAYWTRSDRQGYIRVAAGTQPPGYNAWSQTRLGPQWWYHVDD